MPLTETETQYLSGWNAYFVPWPEYSCSLPSATYPGKRWRGNTPRGWVYREFYEIDVPDRIGIRNLSIIIV